MQTMFTMSVPVSCHHDKDDTVGLRGWFRVTCESPTPGRVSLRVVLHLFDLWRFLADQTQQCILDEFLWGRRFGVSSCCRFSDDSLMMTEDVVSDLAAEIRTCSPRPHE